MGAGFWTVIFMGLVLKIPLVALCCLVWWAIKAEPEPHSESDEERGPRKKMPPFPRWPRRGPAGGGAGCKDTPCREQAPFDTPAPAVARLRQ